MRLGRSAFSASTGNLCDSEEATLTPPPTLLSMPTPSLVPASKPINIPGLILSHDMTYPLSLPVVDLPSLAH